MYRLIAGAAISLSLMGTAVPAQASGLTTAQVSAIVGLLQSFGADQSVINNVSVALGGSPTSGLTCVALFTNLSAGTTDTTTNGQVSRLQQFLGISPTTGYFGPITLRAVQLWQAAHGIVSSGSPGTTGWGFVGEHTRAMMGCAGAQTTTTNTPVIQTTTSVVSTVPTTTVVAPPTPTVPSTQSNTTTSSSSAATSTNPNLVNLDKYLSKLQDDLTQAGQSPEVVAQALQIVRTQAETMDFQKMYADYVRAAIQQKNATSTSVSKVDTFVRGAISSIEDIFSIHVARAFAPVPFGGFVTYSNPAICNCPPGVLTQLFIALPSAPPPISNIMLTYLNGSQAFPFYTLPLPGVAAVGFYVAGIQDCFLWVGKACILIPSVGQITPIVGSSIVP